MSWLVRNLASISFHLSMKSGTMNRKNNLNTGLCFCLLLKKMHIADTMSHILDCIQESSISGFNPCLCKCYMQMLYS